MSKSQVDLALYTRLCLCTAAVSWFRKGCLASVQANMPSKTIPMKSHSTSSVHVHSKVGGGIWTRFACGTASYFAPTPTSRPIGVKFKPYRIYSFAKVNMMTSSVIGHHSFEASTNSQHSQWWSNTTPLKTRCCVRLKPSHAELLPSDWEKREWKLEIPTQELGSQDLLNSRPANQHGCPQHLDWEYTF